MDFPDAGLTDQEEREQALKDIESGCCIGEYSETGEVDRDQQILCDREGLPCRDIETDLLKTLIEEGKIDFEVEAHPNLKNSQRRIYRVNLRNH